MPLRAETQDANILTKPCQAQVRDAECKWMFRAECLSGDLLFALTLMEVTCAHQFKS